MVAAVVRPLLLDANRFPRFYHGGERIDALRGLAPGEPGPEDWVASTSTTLDSAGEGLSRLPSGQLLRDAIADDPERFLGAEHVARHGADPALLVKLLDAGERLPVHSHPGREFARRHLSLPFGKTEAWIIVEAQPGATVHLGPRAPLDEQTLRDWIVEQDPDAMLRALREVPVAAGDALLVPAGTLHAIGQGILLVELQEPTDLSILVEWRRFGVSSGTEHLGLGWDAALGSIDTSPLDLDEFTRRASPSGPSVENVFPPQADTYFRAQRVRPAGWTVELPGSFAVLVVLGGDGVLRTERGGDVALHRGDTCLVPHAAGAVTLEGDLELLRCLPPAPDAPEPLW
jgi:mannose-6-phosphate isomerase